jgi:hypothetical protein
MEFNLYCNSCQEILTEKNCYRSNDKKYINRRGFLHKCKLCQEKYRKKYMESDYAKKMHRISEAKRRNSNREKYLWTNAKRRAEKNNLEFNIEISDIIIPDLCPVFGTPMKGSSGEYTRDNYNPYKLSAPSIDRIDSSRGYIKGNVIVISARANALKSDANLNELKMLVDWLESL